MSNFVIIRDIAMAAGVSPSTVSYAISGKTAGANIPQKTRERILAIVRESGYKPNRVARDMVLGRQTTIGLVLSVTGSGGSATLIPDMASVLASAGFRLVVIAIPAAPVAAREAVVSLLHDGIAALLCCPTAMPVTVPAVAGICPVIPLGSGAAESLLKALGIPVVIKEAVSTVVAAVPGGILTEPVSTPSPVKPIAPAPVGDPAPEPVDIVPEPEHQIAPESPPDAPATNLASSVVTAASGELVETIPGGTEREAVIPVSITPPVVPALELTPVDSAPADPNEETPIQVLEVSTPESGSDELRPPEDIALEGEVHLSRAPESAPTEPMIEQVSVVTEPQPVMTAPLEVTFIEPEPIQPTVPVAEIPPTVEIVEPERPIEGSIATDSEWGQTSVPSLANPSEQEVVSEQPVDGEQRE